jgi:hypothetical protein
MAGRRFRRSPRYYYDGMVPLCDSPTGLVTQFLETHEQVHGSAAEAFVRIAENTDIDSSFDHSALCKNTTWREGLVFRLRDSTGGGIGNVKNTFLNNLRFSIEAGGEWNHGRWYSERARI